MDGKMIRDDILKLVEEYFTSADLLYHRLPRKERDVIGKRMLEGALDVLLLLQRSELAECFDEECSQAMYCLHDSQSCLMLLNQRRGKFYPDSIQMQRSAQLLQESLCKKEKPITEIYLPRADVIRKYVVDNIIQPARQKGIKQITVRAGDIHREMKLQNRMPAVCGALDAAIFEESANIIVSQRRGPKQSASVEWVLELK